MQSQQQFSEWSKSLIGRTWEIYWEPEASSSSGDTAAPQEKNSILPSSSSSLTSSSDRTPIFETDEEDDSSYDADWYDGLIRSYSPSRRIFEVVFVGDETVYEMELHPERVRPLERSSKMGASAQGEHHTLHNNICPITQEQESHQALVGESCINWKEFLVGKDWEIYWDPRKTTGDFEDQQHIDFDADWYEGKVQSYSSATNIFHVSFTGEDCVYQMYLGPEVVRPSVRAWIRRTRYLLSVNTDDREWCKESQLPPLSATYDKLNSIKSQIESSRVEGGNNIVNSSSNSGDVLHLRQKIDEQIILFDHLTIDSQDFIDDTASPKIRTEHYIEYLLRCLDINRKACIWYHETNHTLAQTSRDLESIDDRTNYEPELQREVTSIPLEVNDIYNNILLGLHLYMRLVMMNIDDDAVHATKKRQSPPFPNKTRRNKRRRRNSSVRYHDFATASSQRILRIEDIVDINSNFDVTSNQSHWDLLTQWLDENLDDDIENLHPCLDIFHKLQEKLKLYSTGSRFLVQQISYSLRATLLLIWDNVLNWLLTLKSMLLCKILPFEPESANLDDSDPRPMYKEDDIQRILAFSGTDPLLRKFNLSFYKTKLQEKMNNIKEFERKVWSIIATCTNNNVKLLSGNDEEMDTSEEEQSDHTICELRNVQNEMKTNPYVKNILPIGCITDKSVNDAIELRLWVIRFHRVQQYRERASLISSLQSSNIYECFVQHNPTQEVISPILNKMKRTLDTIWSEYEQKINPQLPVVALEYNCENECDKVLRSLSQHAAISSCEEKLAILADILALKKMIQNTLHATPGKKVDFETVQCTYDFLDGIKRGKSKRRIQLTAGLRQNKQIEHEMQVFTMKMMGKHIDNLELDFVGLYNFGRAWVQSVQGILKLLKMEDCVQSRSLNISTKVQMVDFTKIEEFIKQYNDGNVSCSSFFEKLTRVYNDVTSWVHRLTIVMTCSQEFYPLKCLSQLTELRSTRPKGILMYPPRYLIDSWIDLLKWYVDCTSEIGNLRNICSKTSIQRESNTPLLSPSYSDTNSFIHRGIELIHDSSISTFHNILCSMSFASEDSKTSSKLLLEKVRDHPEGQQLLDELVSYDRGLGFNGVIVLCRSLMWEQSAVDLLHRNFNLSPVTLKDAQALLKLFRDPCHNDLRGNIILESIEKTYATLEQRIKNFERIENNATNLLGSVENLSCEKVAPDLLLDLTNQLKSARDEIKTSYYGFRVDKSIESRINHKIKDLHWLMNILKYPKLIQNLDLKQIPSINTDALSSHEKISSQELIGLCDKRPQVQQFLTEDSLDAILVEISRTLTKLKSTSDNWEAKVLSKLPLSTRGLKRRKKIIPETNGKGNDKSADLITRKELQELTSHPVLDVVETPLYPVVQRVLENVIVIEDALKDLLTSDIDSDNIDRTPIPTSTSLIGSHGEFSIFKLVGGTMFIEMQKRLNKVDSLCDELDDIKTVEVMTMQWISNAVHWIESLSSLMVFGKNAKLELSLENAEELAVSGASLLLGVDDVVKKFILRHKISIYTNDKTRNFSVKITRGGITHTIGAYVLRWIEYCFNGLRGDIYEAYEFTKRVENFSAEDDSSQDTIESLSAIRANLFVSPAREINEYFADLCNKHNLQNKMVTSNVNEGDAKTANIHKFDHNLILG